MNDNCFSKTTEFENKIAALTLKKQPLLFLFRKLLINHPEFMLHLALTVQECYNLRHKVVVLPSKSVFWGISSPLYDR